MHINNSRIVLLCVYEEQADMEMEMCMAMRQISFI